MRRVPIWNRVRRVVAWALVDDEDYPMVARLRWHLGGDGYAVHSYKPPGRSPRVLPMHRLIMPPPDGLQIDHINGRPRDNRKANLRVCNQTQNQWNRVQRGVTHDKRSGLWLARIQHNGVKETVGWFRSERAALAAYRKRAKELRGRFYRAA